MFPQSALMLLLLLLIASSSSSYTSAQLVVDPAIGVVTPAKSGGGSPCPCGLEVKTYDFNDLNAGDYVTTLVPNELRVTAMMRDDGDEVYTPDGAARVFDSSDPQPDFDLGTPNGQCPTPGPGLGAGGVPGAAGENCVALGNLIIVQRRDKLRPDDAEDGGILDFEVDVSARMILNEIGILDVPARVGDDYIPATVEITNVAFPNEPFTFQFDGAGANGFQNIGVPDTAPIRYTRNVQIDLPYDAGIAYLKFCEYVSDFPLPGQEGLFRKLRGSL